MRGNFKNPRDEFILEHHRQLWAGIARHQTLRWEWQKFGMIGTFGFYAVVFAKDFPLDAPLFKLALWLPVLLNVLGLIVSFGIRKNGSEMAKVNERIEKEFRFEGWETSQTKRRDRLGLLSLPTTVSTYGFWLIMTGVTAATAFYFA